MFPSMVCFKKALSDPKSHFKRLQSAEPILCNGDIVIRCTYTTIEAEVLWNNRCYLLSLPFKRNDIRQIEEIELIAKERSRGPLIENIILYDELTLSNSLGRKHSYNVVLQDISCGTTLQEAVLLYKSEDIQQAIERMKERLDAIGFCHNNLHPSNILISANGVAHPIRYWYAKWENLSDNNLQRLTEFINQYAHPEHDLARKSFIPTLDKSESSKPVTRDGITRIYKNGRYGFIDSDNRMITRFVFTWASDFKEGRAIVVNGSKMGVIDENGRKIIRCIYDNIEFDLETGIFTATLNGQNYLIDYDGYTIKQDELSPKKEKKSPCGWRCRYLCSLFSKK